MKSPIILLCILLCTCYPILSSAQKDSYGTWGYDNTKTDPGNVLNGSLFKTRWKEIETSNNEWNWKSFDSAINVRIKDGLPIIILIFTKQDAPDWLFEPASKDGGDVPKVIEYGNENFTSITGYAPYYPDENYKHYFKRMITKVKEHITSMPAATQNKILGIQACYGSTGDYISYKGFVKPQYALTDGDFLDLYKEFATFYNNTYSNTSIRVLHNPKTTIKGDAFIWTINNMEKPWAKAGVLATVFQFNDEKDIFQWLIPALNERKENEYVRNRAELNGNNITVTDWWVKQPYRNAFALVSAGLHVGLDIMCVMKKELEDKNYLPAFHFFNTYAGQKNGREATNGFCALRDGLDFSDTERFPESRFGIAFRENSLRVLNILDVFKKDGAKLEDMKAATTKNTKDNTFAKGTNDIGWRIHAGNYEKFVHQLNANATSIGHWNVKAENDPHSIYGRFARGFEHSTNKNKLYFDINDAFFGNAPLNGAYTVEIKVTYLDEGTGKWSLHIDALKNRNNLFSTITKKDTKTWKTVVFKINRGYFGNRGLEKSDFYLSNPDSEDDIFALVEIEKKQAKTAALQSELPAVTDEFFKLPRKGDGISITPNPVTTSFVIQHKDFTTNMRNIRIYNQAGILLFDKNVNSTSVRINKSEIGNSPGTYFISVLAGEKTWNSKIIVL